MLVKAPLILTVLGLLRSSSKVKVLSEQPTLDAIIDRLGDDHFHGENISRGEVASALMHLVRSNLVTELGMMDEPCRYAITGAGAEFYEFTEKQATAHLTALMYLVG